ncbi:MAG TPA: hypothetical protein VK067_08310 [Pseudogracilibacillus sp.]|nr:hypothetical protein [Pseudogracilibacillus sp.]
MLYVFFFIFVIPICVLLHEVGHGIGLSTSSNAHVHIYLGLKSKSNKENFQIGRMHFHLQWSYIGFVSWDKMLSKREKAFALAGGLIMSLILALLCGIIALVFNGKLQTLFGWTSTFNFIQFLVTIIPIRYPQWMGGYSGLSSDGLQLLKILKDEEHDISK